MKSGRILKSYIVLIMILIVFGTMCVCIGSVQVSLLKFFEGDEISRGIIMDIRLPRMLASVFAGGALAVSGYCLQTYFHNPIAGPYLLGISSGAKLTVALMLVILAGKVSVLGSFSMIIASFAGAMIAMGFVLFVSRYVGSMSMLLVCGVMIGYICTAICDFVVTFADDSDIVNLHNWSRGSLSGINMSQAIIMVVTVMAAVVLVQLLAKSMSAFLVSENYAKCVGVNVNLFKVILVILSSLLSATVTAFAGPVSFVGIAVPHIVRKLMKTAKPQHIIPACFIGGA